MLPGRERGEKSARRGKRERGERCTCKRSFGAHRPEGMEDASAYDGYRDLMVNVLYTGSVNPTKPS
eukprot:1972287-Rhodomonas_salina.1